jgi:hypothetical protein
MAPMSGSPPGPGTAAAPLAGQVWPGGWLSPQTEQGLSLEEEGSTFRACRVTRIEPTRKPDLDAARGAHRPRVTPNPRMVPPGGSRHETP